MRRFVPSPRSRGEAVGALLHWRASVRVISDGLAGHDAQTIGIAEALGLTPDIRRVAPRGLYALLAPFGPPDPRDRDAFAPPYPDIAIAAGRRTIPALQRLKRASNGATFTVYVNAPATGLATADLIVAPLHDRLSGPNVIAPLTPPNRITPERLAAARAAPDPRVAALPCPRVAMLVGGLDRRLRFDVEAMAETHRIVRALLADGFSVMTTPSRRTPPLWRESLRDALWEEPRGFFWKGDGENPYFSMLANADAILVTADSVNMIGEATATGAPVYAIRPKSPRRKIRDYLAALEGRGAIRDWSGTIEARTCARMNSTPMIAAAVADAFKKRPARQT